MVNWLREWLRGPPGPPGPPGPMGANGRDCEPKVDYSTFTDYYGVSHKIKYPEHKRGFATPVDIEGATNVLGPPANWDSEKYGECSYLSVIKTDYGYISEWELPSKQKVLIHITGNFHPPIAIEAV